MIGERESVIGEIQCDGGESVRGERQCDMGERVGRRDIDRVGVREESGRETED